MDRVNGRPCYCSIGAGGTPCIDRKYCDALREIERLRAALERIVGWPDEEDVDAVAGMIRTASKALQEGE